MKMKVRCVGYKASERCFTKDKIYDWEDGKLVSDNGFVYDTLVKETNIDDWLLNNWYIFEKVEEEMNNKEIFNMLKHKLEKNGIDVDCQPECFGKAVALAYTVGYKRAEKGRPFKYDNKTSNSFVVDKNGNKIYYNDDEVKIGDKVVFTLKDERFCDVWPEYGTTGKVVEYGFPEGEGFWVMWEGESRELHNWRDYCKKVVD